MDKLPLSVFDLAVFGVVLLSMLIAFSSGLVRSVLFLVTWAGSVAIAWLLFPHTGPIANNLISVPIVADIAAAVVPFVVTLIVLSVFTDTIGKSVHASGFKTADRALGLLLGLAFGCFIVSLLFLFYLYLFPNQQPEWMRQARTLPALEQGARMIESFLPEEFRRKITDRIPATPPANPPATPPGTPPAGGSQGSLTPDDRAIQPPKQ